MMRILDTDIPQSRLYVELNTGKVWVFDNKLDMYTKDNPREIKFKLSNHILELTEIILLNKGERY